MVLYARLRMVKFYVYSCSDNTWIAATKKCKQSRHSTLSTRNPRPIIIAQTRNTKYKNERVASMQESADYVGVACLHLAIISRRTSSSTKLLRDGTLNLSLTVVRHVIFACTWGR
jgi:hypothetical protein